MCYMLKNLKELQEKFKIFFRRILLWNRVINCGFPVITKGFFFEDLNLIKSGETPWFIREFTMKYGKTYAMIIGAHPIVVTSDINLIQEICLKNFHLFHSRMVSFSKI